MNEIGDYMFEKVEKYKYLAIMQMGNEKPKLKKK